MSEAYINVTHANGGDVSVTDWYNVEAGDESVQGLGSTGWSFQFTTSFTGIPGGEGTTDGGTGDAAWVAPGALLQSARGGAVGQWTDLDDSKTYTVYGISSYTIGGRSSSWTVNGGGTPQITNDVVGGNPNTTESAVFTEVSPSSGVITIEVENEAGSGDSYVAAMGIAENAGPSVTLDNATLTPGSTISGSYANFAGVPTSPLVLTDSGSNTLNVTVTITDNGDGTGTFTGTMPTLPAQGASAAGLLFGSVNAELTDPGA
ncbi:hypothetical protein [Marinobacter sp. OP 3.4]|uniref:hypothetical protein n=1 Tax=Marinobacter sp. OP 3.4 TaxID=3076501 RepID=UPI002E1FE5AE